MILLGVLFFFGIPIALIIIGGFMFKSMWGHLEMPGFLCVIIGIVILLMVGLGLGISQATAQSNIINYEALKETLENARLNGDKIERAAVVKEVITNNKVLAQYKYWNKTILDIFIPDEMEDLEIIK